MVAEMGLASGLEVCPVRMLGADPLALGVGTGCCPERMTVTD